jgi:superfamily I DNA/RNA helicase
MEEERRLAYVIVTRARDKLFLGCAAQRLQESRDPSRFLIEVRDRIENDRRE